MIIGIDNELSKTMFLYNCLDLLKCPDIHYDTDRFIVF